MTVQLRKATTTDAPAIVQLLGAHWPGWSLGKYAHYYFDYPGGSADSFVAEENGLPVAHVGLLPVRAAKRRASLVVHVLVSPAHRRGATLIELIRFAQDAARRSGSEFLCGFANKRFAKVAERLLGWRIAGYLRFATVGRIELAQYRDRFRFEYDPAWYRWKLGRDDEDPALRPYEKQGEVLHQLIKTRTLQLLEAHSLGVPALNLWDPALSVREETGDWIQPFVISPLSDALPDDLFDIRNWFIEMGDSDTFEPYRPWEAQVPLSVDPNRR